MTLVSQRMVAAVLGPWQSRCTRGNDQDTAAVLAYAGAALVAAWGLAHAIPTRQVLASLEPITALTGARTPVIWFKICPRCSPSRPSCCFSRACSEITRACGEISGSRVGLMTI